MFEKDKWKTKFLAVALGQAVSLLRGLFLIIPAALLLSTWLGVPGIWLSFPAAELLTLVIGGWIYLKQGKRRKK